MKVTGDEVATVSKQQASAEKRKNSLLIVLVLTGAYMAVEVAGGLWTGSLALLADAGHMVTDVGGLALAVFAIKMAERPPSKDKTFGYLRAEILAALTNAIVLVFISLYVMYEAYERFMNPPQVSSLSMSVIAIVGLVVNVIGIMVLRSGSSDSLNLRGAYFEVVSDLLTSIGVIAAGVIMQFTGWYYADPIVSSAIGLLILPRTWILIRDSVSVLLEATPAGLNLDEIRKELKAVKGVSKVHDMHVWALTSGVNYFTAHVVRSQSDSLNAILNSSDKMLREKFPIHHVTIQVEDGEYSEQETHI